MSGTATAPAAAQQGSGMRRIAMPTESYQHPSIPLSEKRLLNLMAEAEPSDARSPVALIPTPGLTLYATFGTGPIFALNDDLPGRVYAVSGTEFYRQRQQIDGSFIDDLGSVGAAATDVLPAEAIMVTIAVAPTACVVCVPPNAYTCTHDGALNQITGSFPGAATVAYMDGYFVFTSYGDSAQFFISALLDPTAFNALDFAFADGLPNIVRRVMCHRGELWFMGDAGSEVWYDNGVAGAGAALDFPLQRRPGAVFPYPVATPRSIVEADGSLFWVCSNGVVVRTDGYQAVRVSTHAVEEFIQRSVPTLVDTAVMLTIGGHIIYAVTIAGQTLAYDCATKLWHNRSSSADGTARWLPSCHGGRQGVLVGDYNSGNVYIGDSQSGLENGVAVMRQAFFPPIWAGTNRAFMSRLEVEMEVGAAAPGTIMIEWSDDGGFTFGTARTLNTGTFGQRRLRVCTTRLGSFRQRVFRLTLHGHATLYGVDAAIAAGAGG